MPFSPCFSSQSPSCLCSVNAIVLAFILGLSYIAQLYGGEKQKEIDLLLGTEDGLKELRGLFFLFFFKAVL